MVLYLPIKDPASSNHAQHSKEELMESARDQYAQETPNLLLLMDSVPSVLMVRSRARTICDVLIFNALVLTRSEQLWADYKSALIAHLDPLLTQLRLHVYSFLAQIIPEEELKMMFAEAMTAEPGNSLLPQVKVLVDVSHAQLSQLQDQTSEDASSKPALPTKYCYLTEDAVTALHTKFQVHRRDPAISQIAEIKTSLPRKVGAKLVEEEKFLIETEDNVFYHNAHLEVSSMTMEIVLNAHSDKKLMLLRLDVKILFVKLMKSLIARVFAKVAHHILLQIH